VLTQVEFSVPVGLVGDFERFAEGVADAGEEIVHATLDLLDIDFELRDRLVQVQHGRHWHTHVEHHVDRVALGNDTIAGGDGKDLVVGDDFVTRTATVTVVPGGTPEKYGDDDDWQDDDWKDRYWWDWDDPHHHHHHHDHDDHHWHVPSVRIASDTISGGAGDDVVWGDSLAVVETSVKRGTGVGYKDFDGVDDDADDAIEVFATLTDSADYWLALQDHHHDDDQWNADVISGGDGHDILFGQVGEDRLRGDAGDDWLVGGDGKDDLEGGLGKDKETSGSENSSSLRSAVKARLVNWADKFSSFGLPFKPFGGLELDRHGKPKPSSFDFLEIDD
jgi:Ca2+-binding RTX toxin-like protein